MPLALPTHAESLMYDFRILRQQPYVRYDITIYEHGGLETHLMNLTPAEFQSALKVWELSGLTLSINYNRYCLCGLCFRTLPELQMDWHSFGGNNICAECSAMFDVEPLPKDSTVVFEESEVPELHEA